MFRQLVVALALLHLGPGAAFALLAFGCDATPPALGGGMCERGALAGLPLAAGPILPILALEQGAAFSGSEPVCLLVQRATLRRA